ncbi:hypothetical protein PoB_004372400 [Plakobranchus ocellatus]|uniref:Uncharacterized protein n=1 Tax=Plakobranchus ocellatus TaxID=259542 RepID=A0AAV4BFU2_9GAST|nr:hypothetical protein PoB_004372400 [Plakobranchus ocellatus]
MGEAEGRRKSGRRRKRRLKRVEEEKEEDKMDGVGEGGDLKRLSGPPSDQGAGGGTQTCDRRVPVDLRADSLAIVPPSPLWLQIYTISLHLGLGP